MALGQDVIKQIEIDAKFEVSEIRSIFKHWEAFPPNEKQSKEIVLILEQINSLQQILGVEKTKNLLQVEFYKYFLDNPILNAQTSLQVTPALLSNLKIKLKRNSILYTTFAKGIFEKSITEFAPYLKDNYLNNYLSYKSTQGDIVRGNKLKRSLKYLAPWLTIAYQKTPEEFNQQLTLFTYQYFKRLEQIINIYKIHLPKKDNKNFSPWFMGITPTLKTKMLKEKKQIKKDDGIRTIEERKKESQKAKDFIKDIDVEDLDPAREKIDEMIKSM